MTRNFRDDIPLRNNCIRGSIDEVIKRLESIKDKHSKKFVKLELVIEIQELVGVSNE